MMNISDYTSVQSPALKQKDSDSMINQWKDQRMRRLEDYSREFSQPEKKWATSSLKALDSI